MRKDPTDKLNLWCSSYHLCTLHLRTPRWTRMAFRWEESCQLAAHFDTPSVQVSEPYPTSSSVAAGLSPLQEDLSTQGASRLVSHPGGYMSCVTKRDSCERCSQAFVWIQSHTALLVLVLEQSQVCVTLVQGKQSPYITLFQSVPEVMGHSQMQRTP